MKGGMYHFRQSLGIALKTRWVAPYLLIPPMLAIIVRLGILVPPSLQSLELLPWGNTSLALWHASFLVALISGIESCLFLSGIWESRWMLNSLALPVKRASAFWGPFLAVLTVSTSVYALTVGAVLAALPGMRVFPLTLLLLETYVPVLWAVSVGAFLGMLTSRTGAVVLMIAWFVAGSVPLERISHVPVWVTRLLPPLGSLVSSGINLPESLLLASILLVHALLALVGGRILFELSLSRN